MFLKRAANVNDDIYLCRWFFSGFSIILFPFIIVYFWTFSELEAFDGTLTRIGGFLERDYGWHGDQYRFASSGCLHADSVAKYDKYFDVVVIGDSFAENDKNGYPVFLANALGLSVIVFHIRNTALDEILNSRIFRESPPRALIVQSYDTFLMDGQRMPALEAGLAKVQPFSRVSEERVRTVSATNGTPSPLVPEKRITQVSFQQRLEMTSDYLSKALIRKLIGGGDLDRVVDVSIDCNTCFSNALTGHYLDWGTAFREIPGKAEMLGRLQHFMTTLKAQVENNEKTKVYFLMFPMKSFIYGDKLAQRSYTLVDAAFLYDKATGAINLIDPMKRAVRDGVRDVYLPNDHHTGYDGNREAYRAIVNRMKEDGLLALPAP